MGRRVEFDKADLHSGMFFDYGPVNESFASHKLQAGHNKHGYLGQITWDHKGTIHYVEVEPEFRKRGVGSRLVEEAAKHGASFTGSTAVSEEGAGLMSKYGYDK